MTPQLKSFLASGTKPPTEQSRNALLDEARSVIMAAADIAHKQSKAAASLKASPPRSAAPNVKPIPAASLPAKSAVRATYDAMPPGTAKRNFRNQYWNQLNSSK